MSGKKKKVSKIFGSMVNQVDLKKSRCPCIVFLFLVFSLMLET